FEHPVAWLSVRVAVDQQQRFVVQRGQSLEHVVFVLGVARNVRGGRQRAAAGEYGESAKQPPVGRRQQVVAPLRRRVGRLVARHRAYAARQQSEAIVEPRPDVLDGQHTN